LNFSILHENLFAINIKQLKTVFYVLYIKNIVLPL